MPELPTYRVERNVLYQSQRNSIVTTILLGPDTVPGARAYDGPHVRWRKIHSDISPTSPLIFTGGGQKYEIWRRFSTPVTFESSWLQNRGTYLNSNSSTLSDDDQPSFRPWHFSHPSSNITGVKYVEIWPNFRLCGAPLLKGSNLPDNTNYGGINEGCMSSQNLV